MSHHVRPVTRVILPQFVMEGAGVRLRRSIATRVLDYLDPFLLFDHFGSDDPADYLAGFPMHPHRGIETVTYMLEGAVRHRDSIGNAGTIGAGDVQWMTAGGGIMHEEMPEARDGRMSGFQLWVNLPARLKMTRPRYQEIAAASIPEVALDNHVLVRVIAGSLGGTQGAVTGIAADPTYLDVSLPAGDEISHEIDEDHTAFLYPFAGRVRVAGRDVGQAPVLVVLGEGGLVSVRAETPARFLLVSGKPLGEPIARYGPFVMNTREEIEQALIDLRNGTFVRDR